MKKAIKIVLISVGLIVAAAVAAFCINFCIQWYQLEKQYVEYTDASRQAIDLRGDIYQLIEIDDSIQNMLESGSSRFFEKDTINSDKYHIKDKGTSAMFNTPKEWGDSITVYDDLKVLSVVNDDESISYFIREDVFDEYKTALADYRIAVQNAAFDQYCFHSFQRVLLSGHDYTKEERAIKLIVLDESAAELVDKAKASSGADRISYDELHENDENHLIIMLMRYDDTVRVYDGKRVGALIKDDGRYYIWNGNRDEEKNIYPLSDDEAIPIKKVFEENPNGIETRHSLH